MAVKKLMIIDDHTGKELEYGLIGIWVSDRGKIGAGLDTPLYSINEIYIGVDGNIHLGEASVGPNVTPEVNGVIETPFDKWTLIKMSPEAVYLLLKRASRREPTFPPLKQSF